MSKRTFSHLEALYHQANQGPTEMTQEEVELALMLLDSHEEPEAKERHDR